MCVDDIYGTFAVLAISTSAYEMSMATNACVHVKVEKEKERETDCARFYLMTLTVFCYFGTVVHSVAATEAIKKWM